MKVFRGLPNADARRPCALTIGNFDGVHLGHQALLAHVGDAARRLGIESAVMTFEPHPREFFAQLTGQAGLTPPRVANLRDKLQAIEAAGIDRIIVKHFNARFAEMSAEEFIHKLLVVGLHVKFLIVGDDFRFGAKRSGDFRMLVEAGKQYGFEVSSVATVTHQSKRISSSAVRSSLKDGDFTQAKNLLGYTYSISGHVQHGRKLGRTLGFPTLNLRIGHRNPVLNGIFVVQVHGLSAQPLPAVASLGVRPTVEDDGRMLLEVHIFDYDANCYGKLVRIEFLQKLRDEEKYIDLETLTDAIAADARAARNFFETPSIT
jgi:riboflavin kinase/FMN adenylyltransferase